MPSICISSTRQTAVPVDQQVRLRQLGGAAGGVVAKSSAKKLAVLIGFVVLIVWCLLVLYVSRIREQMRALDRPGRELVDDEFDQDMSRLLRTGAAAVPSVSDGNGTRDSGARETAARENGVRENGARENGARVILPHGIDSDADEDAADRPGSAPVHDR